MANQDHVRQARLGAAAWKVWKFKNPSIKPDLREADLYRMNLNGSDFNKVDLRGADLGEAELREADLSKANLRLAGLRKADLSKANLRKADLRGADLRGANLNMANLGGAALGGTELSEADLFGADLSNTDLVEADLGLANLVDAKLDGADLTGARLWETQRAGWSIKGVICRHAFWDREGVEPTEYGEGEFERIFAEKPRIVLRYPDGMSPVDLLALPLVVERLQAEHPGSLLQIRSVQNDTGGASVTITVEDVEDRGAEAFAVEVEAMRRDLQKVAHRLREEENLRSRVQGMYDAVTRDIVPLLLERAAPQQHNYIAPSTAPLTIEGPTMSKGDTYNIPGQAGAVGPGARAEGNTFQQIHGGADLPKLAEELGRLRGAMKGEATGTREQDKAIGAVADAEEAAAGGDGSAALEHLKGAGKWALGIAEKIGMAVAVEALKRAM